MERIMKPTQQPPARLVQELIGRHLVLACPATGNVQVVARSSESPLPGTVCQFGAGPRKRPSPRGLSGGPG